MIKIGIDLSINKSIKIDKSNLIDIDCVYQSVEIDDTLVSFIDLSWILPIYIGRYISSSVPQKIRLLAVPQDGHASEEIEPS